MKQKIFSLLLITLIVACQPKERSGGIMTVTGEKPASEMGVTLAHEHILVDFIGADSITTGRYNPDTVFRRVLPYLLELSPLGIQTFFEFTPNYLGRDVQLLKRLAEASGLNIVTNTGYYGAVGEKYLPEHVYTETAEQLAQRWIDEFTNGIDGTGIRPGFMKLSADQGPLTEAQRKIMQAGAIAHLQTGLTIAVHSGDGAAAKEELSIFMENGVAPDAFIWVHAQNEKNFEVFKEMASQGVWVEFDYVHPETIEQYVSFVKYMKENNLLHRTLLSHDAGWYDVENPDAVAFRGYTALHTLLIPRLREEGFTEEELNQLIRKNPAEAFSVRIRKR
jgi:predicted metal-dependent phosphotriesterase family hydrolase